MTEVFLQANCTEDHRKNIQHIQHETKVNWPVRSHAESQQPIIVQSYSHQSVTTQSVSSQPIEVDSGCHKPVTFQSQCCELLSVGEAENDAHSLQEYLPFGCNFCTDSFLLSEDLMRHLISHLGDCPMRCRICSEGFSEMLDFETHVNERHKFSRNRKNLNETCCGKPDLLGAFDSNELDRTKHNDPEILKNVGNESGTEPASRLNGTSSMNCVDNTYNQHTSAVIFVVNEERIANNSETVYWDSNNGINSNNIIIDGVEDIGTNELTLCTEERANTVGGISKNDDLVENTNETYTWCGDRSEYVGNKDGNTAETEPSWILSASSVMSQNHTGHTSVSKVIPCHICGKRLRGKGIHRHMKIHTGWKPYKCDECGKAFLEKRNLIKHTLIHSGEKPFKCDQCEKAMNQASSLKAHKISCHGAPSPHMCKHCGKAFDTPCNLKKHVKTHNSKKKYVPPCPHCQCVFKSLRQRRIHILTHNEAKTALCDLCPEKFHTKAERKKHIREGHGEKPYKCTICEKEYSQKSLLTSHFVCHVRPYKCVLCDSGFKRKILLQEHLYTHTGEKPYLCDMCGQQYKQACTLKIHLQMHAKQQKLSCRLCWKEFSGKAERDKHWPICTHRQSKLQAENSDIVAKEHDSVQPQGEAAAEVLGTMPTGNRDKKHICHICGKATKSMYLLKQHIRSHTGEKPFSCRKCGKAFAVQQNLRSHEQRHLGIKKFQCPVCIKPFFDKKVCKQHELTHRKIKPYTCEVCSKSFTQLATLKEHSVIHLEKADHLCQFCGKKFHTPCRLKSHLQTHKRQVAFNGNQLTVIAVS